MISGKQKNKVASLWSLQSFILPLELTFNDKILSPYLIHSTGIHVNSPNAAYMHRWCHVMLEICCFVCPLVCCTFFHFPHHFMYITMCPGPKAKRVSCLRNSWVKKNVGRRVSSPLVSMAVWPHLSPSGGNKWPQNAEQHLLTPWSFLLSDGYGWSGFCPAMRDQADRFSRLW